MPTSRAVIMDTVLTAWGVMELVVVRMDSQEQHVRIAYQTDTVQTAAQSVRVSTACVTVVCCMMEHAHASRGIKDPAVTKSSLSVRL